jgi:hypothetical protein
MSPAVFEPPVPANEWPQTLAIDHSATGISRWDYYWTRNPVQNFECSLKTSWIKVTPGFNSHLKFLTGYQGFRIVSMNFHKTPEAQFKTKVVHKLQ